MLKKITAALITLSLCLTLTGCSDFLYELLEESEPGETESIEMDSSGHFGDPNQTWAIYWYLCGSDLESDGGMATWDLEEMLEVDLPENVEVVIQTGGAYEWQNDIVSADSLQRYVYNSQGFELVDEVPIGNMGDPRTLADFLYFCKENYPADKTMALFWNHGGGSVSGAAFDELYDDDSLTLGEFYQAFDAVYQISPEKPPFEVIGFDTCLMGSIDTAYVFGDIAKYLVASEETEPGGGWLYSGWLQALADDPSMDGAWLGKQICDTYLQGCQQLDAIEETTLSVIDLSKIDALVKAYDEMGVEALTYALENHKFVSELRWLAEQTQNYGGNTREQGYTNMVDLGHLAENCKDVLPHKSQDVINKLNDCVVYSVNGPYCSDATGLSCYYSYSKDEDDLAGFQIEGCSEAFKHFFDYTVKGSLTQAGLDYIDSIGLEGDDVPEIPSLDDEDAVFPLYLDEDGYATLELDEETADKIQSVKFQLVYMDEEEDIMLDLGIDNDVDCDWDNGIFKDNFRGVWGAIDENIVYMEVSSVNDDYTLFSVPILLNGDECNLHVAYEYDADKFEILGARKAIDENGMADKRYIKLKPGDEITTIHYAFCVSVDDDFEAYEIDTFTVTENTSFEEVDLGDGVFIMTFVLEDARGNTAYSELIQFTVEGEDVEVEILGY